MMLKEVIFMNRAFTIILILSSLNIVIAQGLKYERKSISYVDILYLSDPEIKIGEERKKYLLKKLREYIEMPRFDYNPIPEELVADFKSELESRGSSISLDEIVELLKEKFVPKIIEILDIEKEIRAQGLLTEAQRNSFIATKAKSLGITAEQAMKIMNSAFIYVPVISKYNTYISGQAYVVKLSAGVVWYRVVYSEDGTSDLKLVAKKEIETTASTGLVESKSESILDAILGAIIEAILGLKEKAREKAKEKAFKNAVDNLVREIQIYVRDIPEFRLGEQVVEVYGNTISFPLGLKEGLKVDDGFDLIEKQEKPDGKIIERKIGFARVFQVADNRSNPNQFSKARILIGNGIEPGIYAYERPRAPIDLLISFKNNPFAISSEKMMGYSIHFDILYNFGRNRNISQLFVGGGIGTGSGNPENLGSLKGVFKDKPDVLIYEFNVLLLKRFYPTRGLAFVGRADLILEVVIFSKKAQFEHYGFGVAFGPGVELLLSPDINFGFGINYRFLFENPFWVIKDYEGSFSPGLADHTGVVFSIYINYTLPSYERIFKR
jgi:hypothetical protein